MTSQDMDILKIYVLLSPFLVVALALGVYWLTGWMDRREQRQHQAVDQARRASRRIFRRYQDNNP